MLLELIIQTFIDTLYKTYYIHKLNTAIYGNIYVPYFVGI